MTDLVLNRRQNHANITLTDEACKETVGYLRPDGGWRFVPWLGFIDRAAARDMDGALPVRLVNISRVGHGNDDRPVERCSGRHLRSRLSYGAWRVRGLRDVGCVGGCAAAVECGVILHSRRGRFLYTGRLKSSIEGHAMRWIGAMCSGQVIPDTLLRVFS